MIYLAYLFLFLSAFGAVAAFVVSFDTTKGNQSEQIVSLQLQTATYSAATSFGVLAIAVKVIFA